MCSCETRCCGASFWFRVFIFGGACSTARGAVLCLRKCIFSLVLLAVYHPETEAEKLFVGEFISVVD